MISLAPLLLAAIFLVASLGALRAADARHARRMGTVVAAVVASLAGLFVWASVVLDDPSLAGFPLLPAGLLKLAPLVTAVVALLATGLAPLATHGKRTLARILVLTALAEAFLGVIHPLAMALLWTGSAWVAWREYHVGSQAPWKRVFAIYHGVGVTLFLVGATLVVLGASLQTGAVLILFSIGIREAVLPAHSWFPRFVERAPMGVVVAFAGPQLGVYAQLGLLERADLHPFAAYVPIVGAVSAVVAAMLGVAQTSARRAAAYLIISQTGLIAFGLESHSTVGLVGALVNWQVLAVATSGFAMMIAALEARRGDLSIGTPHGNFARTPRLAASFLILGFASVGFPLTLGFVAEDLLVQGSVDQFPLLGFSLVVATAFNGITVMRSFLSFFMGSREQGGERDLTRREGYVAAFAMVALFALGIVPRAVLSLEGHDQAVHVSAPAGGGLDGGGVD